MSQSHDSIPKGSCANANVRELSGVDTLTFAQQDSVAEHAQLRVRCPSCHAPVELAVDTALVDLACTACGSKFSLINESDTSQLAPSLATLGRFELIARLGMGAFGAVWKARDKELDRTVAIKIPRQGGMSADEQEKFFREARAAAQLQHPNIVSVHEVGRDGDSIYIVSDFVRGVTLGDWLTGQKLTNREAAELCAKIADALHHAHEHGVVHRDLKPANIMIDGDEGQPHLMDFGLARREVGEVTVTLDGHVLGTPAYMSPEQAQGESHKADRRSDVYSLGVILFQLLTGELPFRGNARMLIHQVIHDESPSPRTLNGNVPKDLETITLKCLAKKPDRRYQAANELSDEFRRFLRGEPIHARPVSRPERAFRWVRRNRTVSAISAIAILALVSGTFVSTLFAIDARRRANETASVLDFVESNILTAGRPPEHDGGVGREATLRETIQAALPSVESSFEGQPLIEARLRWKLGESFWYLGDLKVAAQQFELSRALFTRQLGPDDIETLESMNGLAMTYSLMGRSDDALKLMEETLAGRKTALGPDHEDTLRTMNSLATIYNSLGRHEEALRTLEDMLSLEQAKFGPNHPDLPYSMNEVASMLATSPSDKVRNGARAVTLATKACELTDYADMDIVETLAAAYAETGDFQSAAKWTEKSLDLLGDDADPEIRAEMLQTHEDYKEHANKTGGARLLPSRNAQ